MKTWFTLIVGIGIILVLLSIMAHIIKVKKVRNSYKLYDPEHIRSKLKTGDIILFACRKYSNMFNKIAYTARTSFLGANYGHLGLIYREGDDIYVVESTNKGHAGKSKAFQLNKKDKKGVRIINYDTLMNIYSKKYKGMFSVRFIDKPISNKKFMKTLDKYTNITFPSVYKLVIVLFIELFISKNLAKIVSDKLIDDNSMTCGNFVYSMLRDCGVLSEYPEKLFWPYKISTDSFKDIQKVNYSKLYRFVCS